MKVTVYKSTKKENLRLKFNVLDEDMKDFEFPIFEDSVKKRNTIGENKVFINKRFFTKFDESKMNEQQIKLSRNYDKKSKDLHFAFKKLSKIADIQKKLISEHDKPDRKNKLIDIQKDFTDIGKEILKLEASKQKETTSSTLNDTTKEKVKTSQKNEINHYQQDKDFVESYSKIIIEAFETINIPEIMPSVISSFTKNKGSIVNFQKNTRRSINNEIEWNYIDEIIKQKEEDLEIAYDEIKRSVIENGGKVDSLLKDKIITRPLDKFKYDIKLKSGDLIIEIEKKYKEKARKVWEDLEHLENSGKYIKKNKNQQENQKIEKNIDNSQVKLFNKNIDNQINKLKEVQDELREIFENLSNKELVKVNVEVKDLKEEIKTLKNFLDNFDIEDYPYVVDKKDLFIYLIKLTKMNLFENTSFGHTMISPMGLAYGMNDDLKDNLEAIVDGVPDNLKNTEINLMLLEEMIVANYQSDLSNKTHIDLFIDSEYNFKVSFEWNQREPELVFESANPYFAIPNLIGTLEEFKELYKKDIDKFNSKVFPMLKEKEELNNKELKSDLQEEMIEELFVLYSNYIRDNYEKLVEAKISSILKTMTVFNHLFYKNSIEESLFVNPRKGNMEYLFTHIPYGKVEIIDFDNPNISKDYYDLLLNYNTGIQTHYEVDETKIIKNNIVVGGDEVNEKTLSENLNIFFLEDSGLIDLLNTENIGLQKNLINRILNKEVLDTDIIYCNRS